MTAKKIYKVFVSSASEGLCEERTVVQKALLQLNCLPVELNFPLVADDEIWNFIKSQIDDSDYYVVTVTGAFESLVPDRIGFAEKMYDYAISKKKPAIGLVHANLHLAPTGMSESSDVGKEKLCSFLKKLEQCPLHQFSNARELALMVTTSFVALIRDRPAIGYVRSDEAVDFKRYASLLEENRALKEKVLGTEQPVKLFPGHDNIITIVFNVGRSRRVQFSCRLEVVFGAIGEATRQYIHQYQVLGCAANLLAQLLDVDHKIAGAGIFDDETIITLRRELRLRGLIEMELMNIDHLDRKSDTSKHESIHGWHLTDYGRAQLKLISS